LWAELLDIGGFDLLLQPFTAGEIYSSVDMARRFGRGQPLRVSAGAA
jgi:hypothetical protein